MIKIALKSLVPKRAKINIWLHEPSFRKLTASQLIQTHNIQTFYFNTQRKNATEHCHFSMQGWILKQAENKLKNQKKQLPLSYIYIIRLMKKAFLGTITAKIWKHLQYRRLVIFQTYLYDWLVEQLYSHKEQLDWKNNQLGKWWIFQNRTSGLHPEISSWK